MIITQQLRKILSGELTIRFAVALNGLPVVMMTAPNMKDCTEYEKARQLFHNVMTN